MLVDSSPTRCKVLIAGAGPAGLATALYLLRARPDLAGQVVALEKFRHPRFKVCAGGLIPKTMLALEELGLDLEVPAVAVTNGRARTEVGDVHYPGGETLCTIIRRDQFDARLARAARVAGLVIMEDCRVLDVRHSDGCVRVATSVGEFECEVLVGADGSGSRVRTSLFGASKESVGRALMVDIPADPCAAEEFANSLYRFDFRCGAAGVQGYSWSFPCLINGRSHLNVGIYDQHPREVTDPPRGKPSLLDELRAAFSELDLGDLGKHAHSFKAFPIRWYAPRDRFGLGRVILAGDAAGVDPLMGEGISCAFEHGKLAADAVARFVGGEKGALATYDRELHQGVVGRKLAILNFAARRFYGPRHRWYFRLAMLSRRAQSIGVDWYNGARHLDEISPRTLLMKWASAVLFGRPVR